MFLSVKHCFFFECQQNILAQSVGLTTRQIKHVYVYVHLIAIYVLGPVTDPQTMHLTSFSMCFVLALIALYGHTGVSDFSDESLHDPQIRQFLDRVEMVLNPEIDAAYPERWIGLVEIDTRAGRRLTSRVDAPKGDPDNTLSRAEIENKAHRLAAYQQGAAPAEMQRVIDRVWTLDQQTDVHDMFPEKHL